MMFFLMSYISTLNLNTSCLEPSIQGHFVSSSDVSLKALEGGVGVMIGCTH